MKSLSVPSHLPEQHKSYQINNVNCYLLGWAIYNHLEDIS